VITRQRNKQEDNNKDKKRKKLKTFRELISEMERNETYQTRHVTLRDRGQRRAKQHS
jgi:hypothetical protein